MRILDNHIATLTAIALAAFFGCLGVAKVSGAGWIRARADHLQASQPLFRVVGLLELAASLGVLGGLWWRPVGYAAGDGLVLLMVGAVVMHTRVGARWLESVPAVLVGFAAVGYLVALGR